MGDRLGEELAWQEDGHVADVVLDAIADGELAIVPGAAMEHLDECMHCTDRLGSAALLSIGATEAIREAKAAPLIAPALTTPVPSSGRRRPRVPVFAIAAALLIAAVAAVPAGLSLYADAPRLLRSASRAVPLVAHVLFAMASALVKGHAASPLVIALSWVSAVLFLAIGIKLARVGSRRQLQGEV